MNQRQMSEMSQTPNTSFVELNHELPHFRQQLCYTPWIALLARQHGRPTSEIEEAVVRFAQRKFYEGNLILPTTLFRYRCGQQIEQQFSPKNTPLAHGKQRYATQQSASPPALRSIHDHPDIDLSRVPGYRSKSDTMQNNSK